MVSLVASSVGSWFSFILLSNRISFLELDHACFDGLLCLVAKPFFMIMFGYGFGKTEIWTLWTRPSTHSIYLYLFVTSSPGLTAFIHSASLVAPRQSLASRQKGVMLHLRALCLTDWFTEWCNHPRWLQRRKPRFILYQKFRSKIP
jgi:hypothetical protein